MKNVIVEQVANGYVATLRVIPGDLNAVPCLPFRIIVPTDKIVAVMDAFLCEGGTIEKAVEAISASSSPSPQLCD